MNANTVVALVRRVKGSAGAYGGDTYTTEVTAVSGVYWPNSVTEARQGGEQVTWQETVCLPDGVDLEEIDALVPRASLNLDGTPVMAGDMPAGDLYEVDGVTTWPTTPWGYRPDFPVEVRLRRVTGGSR